MLWESPREFYRLPNDNILLVAAGSSNECIVRRVNQIVQHSYDCRIQFEIVCVQPIDQWYKILHVGTLKSCDPGNFVLGVRYFLSISIL